MPFAVARRAAPPLLLLLQLVLGAGIARAEPWACPAVAVPPLALPHLRLALEHHQPVIIAALGSSSTEGWRASTPARTYPAALQRLLNAALPDADVAVINRGIGGQDATQELARLEADAVSLRPQLVIWQVGANGALRDADSAVFKTLVTSGIERLHRAGIDVVLMDNQRAPRILAHPDHEQLERALAEVAAETDAALFARSRLMDAWRDAGHPYAEFIAADDLHHNDRGYHCLAAALAHAILDGLDQTEAVAVRR